MRQTRMTELTEADVASLAWGDASVFGYYWDPELEESNVVVSLEPANADRVELVGCWVKKFVIDVDYKGDFKPMLTWAVNFSPGDELRWHVLFDCASDGILEFECEQLYLRPAPAMSAA